MNSRKKYDGGRINFNTIAEMLSFLDEVNGCRENPCLVVKDGSGHKDEIKDIVFLLDELFHIGYEKHYIRCPFICNGIRNKEYLVYEHKPDKDRVKSISSIYDTFIKGGIV